MLDTRSTPDRIGGLGPLVGDEATWYAVYDASRALAGGNVDSARLATDVVLGRHWDGRPAGRPPAPPGAAVVNGHALEWDPPGMSSAERWTCRNPDCGAAAIRYEGNEYGTACELTCDQVAATHLTWRLA